ncbi:MAG: D-alanine--D-alanine ligase [Myxococcales bacterium]|nr:D-alanine--D-alanine ligase [Myxococcales bacterium]
MKTKRIGVLLGGLGPEREVSLRSGEAILGALTRLGYDAVPVYVDRDIDRVLRQSPIDVAFLALHGPYGEDGCIQGLLELLGIPYTGSGVLASALAFDKLKSKELFRLHNVPTPPYYRLDVEELARLEEIHGSFGFPAFVKPRRAGSSVGSGRANDAAELRARCEAASAYDRSILVERFVPGREITVAVLDGRALGALEIVPKGRFYDYESKYQRGQSDYHFPARLPPTRYRGVLTIAERAARCLDTSGAVRVDLLVTEGENEYVLEVNTLPGMTETSLLPMIARGAGMGFDELCEAILQRALLEGTAGVSAGHVAAGAPLELNLHDAE